MRLCRQKQGIIHRLLLDDYRNPKFGRLCGVALKNASEPTVLTNCEVQSMRMKMVCDDRTLAEVANEFLALKKAQKVRERTLNDYKKYIDKFLEQSQNSLDVDVLKIEILEYFADIPKTSPARFNHPYARL